MKKQWCPAGHDTFVVGRTKSSGCKACMAVRSRAWQAKNPEKMKAFARKHLLEKKYGITVDEYDAILTGQGGACAICRRPERASDRTGRLRDFLAVDHDHATGKVRGLLCHHCNTALGHADDSPVLLRAMADYVGVAA